jgi:hypothetical protein
MVSVVSCRSRAARATLAACRTQRLHPAPPVPVGRELSAALVAPGHDMMRRRRIFDAQRPCHDARQHDTGLRIRQSQPSNFLTFPPDRAVSLPSVLLTLPATHIFLTPFF